MPPPQQIAAMKPVFFLSETEAYGRMVSLSDIITGVTPGRTSDGDITLFCAGGLAGTEVLLAADVLRLRA